MDIFREYAITFGWGVTGAVMMAVALPLLLWVFDKFTPIDEWEEIRKGNWAVSLIIATLIFSFALVIVYAIS